MDRQSIQERFGIVGTSPAIYHVIDRARQVAKTDISVLIEGESGSGKELVAEMVHHMSARKHESMVVVNCGAIPEGLIESELFGAEKGAYTGAAEKRSGYFEEADGGTIFLDEIGEMPQSAQVRLLRVLESGEFSRVGSAKSMRTDVRVIAATNKDLATEVEAGRFREDLYYRLSTVLIKMPPLRERQDDILPIFKSYLHRYTQKYNSPPRQLTPEAEELLTRYRWPGNVRELKNVAEQAVVLLRGKEVTADDLRPYLRGVGTSSGDMMPVVRQKKRSEEPSSSDDPRERELLYRALMEIRMEVRELRDEIRSMNSDVGVAVPREYIDEQGFSRDRDDFVILSRQQDQQEEQERSSYIEDASFEIEDEHEEVARDRNGREDEPPTIDDVPTLEEAEHNLIRDALSTFEGNRRQTSQALGISERTLYRKIKQMEAAEATAAQS